MSDAKPRILVIDDEPQIRRLLEISLRAQGYAVEEASSGAAGLAALATHGADLVVLDIGLPDREGHEVLRDIRSWTEVPVIMLSVRASESEKVKALDLGANDYVTKPFGVQELSARVRALLRTRPAATDAPGFDDGHLQVDALRRTVALDGAALKLTPKEWALLVLLLRHRGKVLTQGQLLRELWGPDHDGDSHYLRVLVGKLRRKLGDDSAAPRYIETEPGVGLRFGA
ncbi:MAG: response regulator transcription factor [Xanthomonadales bacterium]|nr:response regulator transcription factor [Xanthomonadales bacterium]